MRLNKHDWEVIEKDLKDKDRTQDFLISKQWCGRSPVIKVYVFAVKVPFEIEAKILEEEATSQEKP